MKLLTLTFLLLLLGCDGTEHLPLKHGVENITKDIAQTPKIVIRDVLDIEDEDLKINEYDTLDEKVEKLQKQVEKLEKEKNNSDDNSDDDDDDDDNLEDKVSNLEDKLECASKANGLTAVKECLE